MGSHMNLCDTAILDLMSEPRAFQSTELNSGLTVIFEPMPWLQTASASLMLPIGSVTDPEGLDGSGTVLFEWLQRGTSQLDSRAFSDSLDALGASRGGSAGREYTTFGASCLAEALPEVLKLIAASILDPRFDENEFPAAQAVALQERASLADNPDQRLFENLGATFFRSAHGRSAYGTDAGLTALTPDLVRMDYNRRVSATGAILGVAGGVTWEVLVDAAESCFGSWQDGGSTYSPPVVLAPGAYLHSQEDTNQVQIGLAFEAVAPTDPFWYHHVVSLQVLSGSTGSRLHTEVREKRGLVYSVGASTRALKGFGYVVGYAGTKPDRASQTLSVIRDELTRMGHGVTRDELERAKTGLLSSLVLQGESSGARANTLVQDIYLRGRPRSLNEIRERLHGISLDEVNQYLADLPEPVPTVVTLGPVPLQDGPSTGKAVA
jgi:predicted Zn-dependent peptidase